jgi:hypothetical protein
LSVAKKAAAKAAGRPAAEKNGPTADGNETVAGYFKRVFAENPKWLKGRSNEEVLKRWEADHPGEKVTASIKNGLSNIKSVLRSKGRRRAKRKAAEAAPPGQGSPSVLSSTSSHGITAGAKGAGRRLEQLEEMIDECVSLARATDREALSEVIDHLRRARNRVVWALGEPG